MKYKITGKPDGIDIEISEAAGKQTQLLEAFRACQEGRCSCPTQEYAKLDALELEASAQTITLRLKAKEGSELDQAEIRRCLEHTEAQVKPGT